ncbi:DUF2690 domain-containing protein [Hamadaea tsunoensis]|uniref:DUF2690 domain-containing protein n=1 Tax=Hamadaea tsunoensis TaxID=53368 RepID=UPI0012FC286B|nr:DUF2690 domain-containing protein [Hamadaea tsunoensis]
MTMKRWLATAAAVVAGIGAALVVPQPALASDCWAAGCDLVWPFTNYSYSGPYSNCGNNGAYVVQTKYAEDFSVSLWYSTGCNSNWATISFPPGGGLHHVSVYSKSSAPDDNGRDASSADGWNATYMVDGRYLAQACASKTTVVCTGWF